MRFYVLFGLLISTVAPDGEFLLDFFRRLSLDCFLIVLGALYEIFRIL